MTNSLPVADTQMAFTDAGEGAPLLLVHGFPLDRSMWRHQVESLSQLCRVIAPDLRGYGGTTLGGPADAVAMGRYADDLVALLDALGVTQPIIYAGFSMGGYIGWEFLRRYANRVRGLMLCDTRAAADSAEAKAQRHKMADHVQEWGARHVAEAMAPKLFAPATLAAPAGSPLAEAVEQTKAVIAGSDTRAIAAAQRGMAARADSTGLLGSVTQPTLAIVGAEDAISTPGEVRAMTEAMPNALLEIIEGAGHMAPVEQPDAVTRAMRLFVEELNS